MQKACVLHISPIERCTAMNISSNMTVAHYATLRRISKQNADRLYLHYSVRHEIALVSEEIINSVKEKTIKRRDSKNALEIFYA